MKGWGVLVVGLVFWAAGFGPGRVLSASGLGVAGGDRPVLETSRAGARTAMRRGTARATKRKARKAPPVSPGWLGMVLHTRGGLAFIKKVVEGWPAERAGLQPGDQVLSVDGKLAQAPLLEDALDALAGPAGTSVQVSVKRPGRPEPLVVTLVRTSRPVPRTSASKPATVDPRSVDDAVVAEAVDAWSRGRTGAVEQVLAVASQRPTDRGAAMLLNLTNQLLDQGGEAAWRAALDVAAVAVDRFPESMDTLTLVRVCFASGTRGGDLMSGLAEHAIQVLAQSSRIPAAERASMTREWEVVQALGWLRQGKTRKGEKQLAAVSAPGPVGLVALRANGAPLWRVAVTPSRSWEDIVWRAIETGDEDRAWQGIRTVLLLDDPAWIYPAMVTLEGRERPDRVAREMLVPRWAAPPDSMGDPHFFTDAGDRLSLADFQQGQPALLLDCPRYVRSCESWRVALSDLLGREESFDLATAIVTTGDGAPPSSAAWPVLKGTLKSRTVRPDAQVLLIDAAGQVIGEWGRYEPGLEYHVLERVGRYYAQPDDAGPYLVRGGVGQGNWTIRWSRWAPPVVAMAWGGGPGLEPRVWLLAAGGQASVYQGGELRWSLSGLGGIDRLQIAQLDGDGGDELLAYHTGAGMLEALDGGPTPLWIAPAEDPIALVARHDLDQDGIDEVFVAREGRAYLTCIRADGTVRWRVRVPDGVASLAFGRVVWAGDLIAVGTRRGEVFLVSPDGRLGPRVDPGVPVRYVAFADLDGDTSDELVVAGPDVQGLCTADLNGDGRAEVVVRAGARQLVVFRPSGRVATRLSWEIPDTAVGVAEMDGDGQEELVVRTPRGGFMILGWLDPWIEGS